MWHIIENHNLKTGSSQSLLANTVLTIFAYNTMTF